MTLKPLPGVLLPQDQHPGPGLLGKGAHGVGWAMKESDISKPSWIWTWGTPEKAKKTFCPRGLPTPLWPLPRPAYPGASWRTRGPQAGSDAHSWQQSARGSRRGARWPSLVSLCLCVSVPTAPRSPHPTHRIPTSSENKSRLPGPDTPTPALPSSGSPQFSTHVLSKATPNFPGAPLSVGSVAPGSGSPAASAGWRPWAPPARGPLPAAPTCPVRAVLRPECAPSPRPHRAPLPHDGTGRRRLQPAAAGS